MQQQYRVLQMFDDLTDYTETKGGVVLHRYHPGDIFPREGRNVSLERAEELMGASNRQGVPLIVPVEPENVTTDAPVESAQPPQTDEKASQTEKPTVETKKPLKKPAGASKKKPAAKTSARKKVQ